MGPLWVPKTINEDYLDPSGKASRCSRSTGFPIPSDIGLMIDPVSLGHGAMARHDTVLVMCLALVAKTGKIYTPLVAAPTLPLEGHTGEGINALALAGLSGHPCGLSLCIPSTIIVVAHQPQHLGSALLEVSQVISQPHSGSDPMRFLTALWASGLDQSRRETGWCDRPVGHRTLLSHGQPEV